MSEIVADLGAPKKGPASIGEIKFFADIYPDKLQIDGSTWLKSDVIITDDAEADQPIVSAFSFVSERGHAGERAHSAVITDTNRVIILRNNSEVAYSDNNLVSFGSSTENYSSAQALIDGDGSVSPMYYDTEYYNAGNYALVSSLWSGYISSYFQMRTSGNNWASAGHNVTWNGTTTIRVYSPIGTNDGKMLYLYSTGNGVLQIAKGQFGSLSRSKKYTTNTNRNGFFARNDDATFLCSMVNENYLLRSTDHGENWTQLNVGIDFIYLKHVAGDKWIGVNTNKYLMVSTDNGATWSNSNIDGTYSSIFSIAKHRTKGVFYATRARSSDTYVYRSKDAQNWKLAATIKDFPNGRFSHVNEKTGRAVLVSPSSHASGNVVAGLFGFSIKDVKNGSAVGYVKIKQD